MNNDTDGSTYEPTAAEVAAAAMALYLPHASEEHRRRIWATRYPHEKKYFREQARAALIAEAKAKAAREGEQA